VRFAISLPPFCTPLAELSALRFQIIVPGFISLSKRAIIATAAEYRTGASSLYSIRLSTKSVRAFAALPYCTILCREIKFYSKVVTSSSIRRCGRCCHRHSHRVCLCISISCPSFLFIYTSSRAASCSTFLLFKYRHQSSRCS
jgi:hypothetical protein